MKRTKNETFFFILVCMHACSSFQQLGIQHVSEVKLQPHQLQAQICFLETSFIGKNAFILGLCVDKSDWKDLAYLATIPAASKINNKKPVVILCKDYDNGFHPDTLTQPTIQFIIEYCPNSIYIIGDEDFNPDLSVQNATINEIKANNLYTLSSLVASRFWGHSATVVLASDSDYDPCLAAAPLASNLECPMLFTGTSTIPDETLELLGRLGVTKVLVVGRVSSDIISQLIELGLQVQELPSLADVNSYLKSVVGNIDYVVLGNPCDREEPLEYMISKASLLAGQLAAYHKAAVCCIRVDFLRSFIAQVTSEKPLGVKEPDLANFTTTFTTQEPQRRAGSTRGVYPVNNKYAKGQIAIIIGHGVLFNFYLASKTANQSIFDVALIDMDRSNDFDDSEIFYVDSTFSTTSWSYGYELTEKYRVVSIASDGSQISIKPDTWHRGTVDINNTIYDVIIENTCSPVISWLGSPVLGKFGWLYIDINGNGRYDDMGEGPIPVNGTIMINNMSYTMQIVLPSGIPLYLFCPSAQLISEQLKGFYQLLDISPKFLAIMGLYDSIPFEIIPSTYGTWEESIATDWVYGQLDEDEFLDVAVGRICSVDIFSTSTLVARSIIHEERAGNKALIVCHSDPWGERLVADDIKNSGLEITEIYGSNATVGAIQHAMQDKSLIHVGTHGSPEGFSIWNHFFTAMDIPSLQKNPIVFLHACSTSGIDELANVKNSIALTFLEKGAVNYIGGTRVVGTLVFPYYYACLLYENCTSGVALMNARNWYLIQNRHQRGEGLYERSHEVDMNLFFFVLLGDPAIRVKLGDAVTRPVKSCMNEPEPSDGFHVCLVNVSIPNYDEGLWESFQFMGLTHWVYWVPGAVSIPLGIPVVRVEATLLRGTEIGSIRVELYGYKISFGSGQPRFWVDLRNPDLSGESLKVYLILYPIEYDPKTRAFTRYFTNVSFRIIFVAPMPVVNFECLPEISRVNELVTFNASASYSPNGKIKKYEWNFGDGKITTTDDPTVNHTYIKKGRYTVTLKVTDEKGLSNSTTKIITVAEVWHSFENVFQTPEFDIQPYQEVKVSVNVTDLLSGVKNVTLSYSINHGAWIELTMTFNVTSGLYEATIPGQPAGTSVKYKIIAYDNAGNFKIEDNSGQYYVYTVKESTPPIPLHHIAMFTVAFAIIICITAVLSLKRIKKKGLQETSPFQPRVPNLNHYFADKNLLILAENAINKKEGDFRL